MVTDERDLQAQQLVLEGRLELDAGEPGAVAKLLSALDIVHLSHGPQDHRNAPVLMAIAGALEAAGDWRRAELRYLRALVVEIVAHGGLEHLDVAIVLAKLSNVLNEQERPEACLWLVEHATDTLKDTPIRTPEAVQALEIVGGAYMARGKVAEATEVFQVIRGSSQLGIDPGELVWAARFVTWLPRLLSALVWTAWSLTTLCWGLILTSWLLAISFRVPPYMLPLVRPLTGDMGYYVMVEQWPNRGRWLGVLTVVAVLLTFWLSRLTARVLHLLRELSQLLAGRPPAGTLSMARVDELRGRLSVSAEGRPLHAASSRLASCDVATARVLLWTLDELDRAVEAAGSAGEAVPARRARADTRLVLGDARAALADFQWLVGQNPGDACSVAGRGAARLHLGDAAAAIADLDNALRLSPHFRYARVLRGVATARG